MSDLTKHQAHVTCLTCGKTSPTWLLTDATNGLPPTAKCPRCSNIAHTQNLRGLWSFMEAAAARIAQINLDMIDLQDDGEPR